MNYLLLKTVLYSFHIHTPAANVRNKPLLLQHNWGLSKGCVVNIKHSDFDSLMLVAK